MQLFAQIPVDAPNPLPNIMYYSTPDTHRYGIAWVHAATLNNNHIANDGYILVEYIKLIEEDITTKSEPVLDTKNYSGRNGQLDKTEGGLYIRFPKWTKDDLFTKLTNSNCSGNILRINVGQEPDSLTHFWGNRKPCALVLAP